jgi:hypothetical protein
MTTAWGGYRSSLSDSRERPVVGLYHQEREEAVRVWCGGEDPFIGEHTFIFHLDHLGAGFSVQTRRAGIEAIRDACNDALVRTDD